MSCKFLGNWEGNLITVNGSKRITRRAVEFTIFNFKLRKPMTIQALVSESELISRKERIPDQRFKTICSSFSLRTEEVDHTAGLCHILIGFKLQSIQTARSRRYRSEDFPEVRVYRSGCTRTLLCLQVEYCGTNFTLIVLWQHQLHVSIPWLAVPTGSLVCRFLHVQCQF